jgi:hypothetical protein
MRARTRRTAAAATSVTVSGPSSAATKSPDWVAFQAAAAVTGPRRSPGLRPASGRGRPDAHRHSGSPRPGRRAAHRARVGAARPAPGVRSAVGAGHGWLVPRDAVLPADTYRNRVWERPFTSARKISARGIAATETAFLFSRPARRAGAFPNRTGLQRACENPERYVACGSAGQSREASASDRPNRTRAATSAPSGGRNKFTCTLCRPETRSGR